MVCNNLALHDQDFGVEASTYKMETAVFDRLGRPQQPANAESSQCL
jgi:hypothetical protein